MKLSHRREERKKNTSVSISNRLAAATAADLMVVKIHSTPSPQILFVPIDSWTLARIEKIKWEQKTISFG